ncbi:Winged helix-turn-helix DNA-binding domain containing protein [Trema orientale]|uniref:Winged helix-turn-helix DNA-binding domain containing protein n=1 Tax=Trema orientale TaxID=63057 RepID=A0A2P5EF05_TREOI|nr:Winged helix-turn-helix DNA-binding domain containing protein [Trema orientale]
MGGRGVVGDKWSMRILWACAIGSAIGLYMVAVERQTQNRERMLAESLKAMESESSSGEDV